MKNKQNLIKKGGKDMYLIRRETLYLTEENFEILQHMGYAAYKLWNIGNYEKRNYKELNLSQYPNWFDQKKRLKDNFFYKNLPSQTAQEVLKQLEEAWKSFFSNQKNKNIDNPKPPRFKHKCMDITFLKDAINQTGSTVRLTISKQLKTYLNSIGINANYLYLKIKRFSNINIKELQVKFLKDRKVELIATYEIPDATPKSDNNHYLSIDLGICNTFTCYDSNGKAFILIGFMDRTHYYDKKIAYLQSIFDSQQVAKGIEYPIKSQKVLNLYTKKKNSVNDFIHKSAKYIVDYCIKNNINKVIVGDLKGIRKDKNIGRLNQQLHSLPTDKILKKLEYKLSLNGIVLIKQKENYSSQCPPNSKEVSKFYAKKSNRKYRGLYIDGKQIYNADCVGAYNILRLYLKKIKGNIPMFKGLSSPVKVSV